MKQIVRASLVVLALGLSIGAATAANADQPRSEEEVALEQTETSVLQIRRQLFQARQRNDQDAIEKLEKKFKKAQDERVRLLRQTKQM